MSLPIPAGRRLGAGLATLAMACTVLAGAAVLGAGSARADNPAPAGTPVGAVESVKANTDGSLAITGWAGDRDDISRNVTAYGLLDGHIVTRTVTSVARPKVAAQYKVGKTPGFALRVRVPNTGTHTVCVGVQNIGAGLSPLLKCVATPLGSALSSVGHSPVGALSSASATASRLTVAGWATEPDFVLRRLVAVLYVDGESVATFNTRAASAAQRQAGAGPNSGFSVSVPVSSGTHMACIWLVNVGPGQNSTLGCQAVDTRGPAGTAKVTTPKINTAVVTEAKKHIGQPYVWGATGPKTFDCSGLVMYSYGKQKFTTPRVSEAQFGAARLIPASRAVPGDLVFWHDGVGDVYHVGIYLSPGLTVAAIDEAEGVDYQKLWDTSIVSYGSFTHT